MIRSACSHVGFSWAIRTTNCRISRRTLHRPGFLAYVHFRAINRRCDGRSVSGVAMVAISRKAARPTRWGPSRQSAAIVLRQMQATIPKLSTRESIFIDEVHDGLSLPHPASQ
jgi:hypothetical protein